MQNSEGRGRIWIDLDNSPHVPFFIPIIEELQKRGYSTFLTARDAYQVVELLDLHHLSCVRVGRHYGKLKVMKMDVDKNNATPGRFDVAIVISRHSTPANHDHSTRSLAWKTPRRRRRSTARPE